MGGGGSIPPDSKPSRHNTPVKINTSWITTSSARSCQKTALKLSSVAVASSSLTGSTSPPNNNSASAAMLSASEFGINARSLSPSSPAMLIANTNRTVTSPAPTLSSTTAICSAPSRNMIVAVTALTPASQIAARSKCRERIACTAQITAAITSMAVINIVTPFTIRI